MTNKNTPEEDAEDAINADKIKRTDLYPLAIMYNKRFRLKTFLYNNVRPSKAKLIKLLREKNYKPVKTGEDWKLKPIKETRRDPYIFKTGKAPPKAKAPPKPKAPPKAKAPKKAKK